MRYATRVDGLGGAEAAAWDIHSEAVERRARGEDIILLSIGDPDFSTPGAGRRRRQGQPRSQGAPTMRPWSASPNCARPSPPATSALSGQSVDPSQVVVLAGAQSALFAACQCLLEPGDDGAGARADVRDLPGDRRGGGRRGSCACRWWPSAASISISRPWRRR